MTARSRTYGPDEIAPIFEARFRPSLGHHIKSALVAWGWLPGWLHVRWESAATAELLNHYFPPSAERPDA